VALDAAMAAGELAMALSARLALMIAAFHIQAVQWERAIAARGRQLRRPLPFFVDSYCSG